MDKVMVGVTEYEEGMEVKLVYQKDKHTKKESYMVLAMNEAGFCGTRVDLIQLLDWVRDNMPELQRREWVGLTEDEKVYSNSRYAGKCAEAWQGGVDWAEDKLKDKNT